MIDKKNLSDYRYLLFFVAVLWIIEIVNYFLGHSINRFGLIPREPYSLYGIATMHFLHSSFNHLISNSAPLLILGFLVAVNRKIVKVTISIALLTGVSVWVAGRQGVHVGASGLVMGYFGYLLSAAFFQKSIKGILLTLLTVIIYGGLVASLLDFRGWVSFEGHLFGFISGILSARIWHPKPEY